MRELGEGNSCLRQSCLILTFLSRLLRRGWLNEGFQSNLKLLTCLAMSYLSLSRLCGACREPHIFIPDASDFLL